MTRVFISLLILIFALQVEAQNRLKRSGEIIREGIALHDNEMYEKAIELYYQVDEADTNYALMLYEVALSYYKMGNYEKAIVYYNKVLEISPYIGAYLYSALGSTYDDDKQTEKALEIFYKGLEYYPHSHLLNFNIAVTYFRQEEYEKATDYFQRTLLLNPYHLNSHNMLGIIAAAQGHYTHALMSWTTYLLIRSGGSAAHSVLVAIEQISNGDFDASDMSGVPDNLTANDFHEIDFIIKSKVALNPRYKSPVKIDAALVKQIKLMIEKIEYNESENDFWMNFYGSFFEMVKKNNFYEPLIYSIIASLNIPEVEKWNKKGSNRKAIDEFVKKGDQLLVQNRDYRTIEIDGKKMKLKTWFFDGYLQALGNVLDDNIDKRKGYWQVFFSNGNLLAEGHFNDNFFKEGVWKYYYEEGGLKSVEEFNSEGKLHGKISSFFEDGLLYSEFNAENGLYKGKAKYHHYCGTLSQSINYKDDLEDGISEKYSYKGVLIENATYTDGKLEGMLRSYHTNGNIRSEMEFFNGKHNGIYRQFNNDGVLVQEGSTKESKAVGEWRYYHNDGTLKATENYDETGNMNGTYKSYAKNGKPDTERFFDNGNITWEKNYDTDDGILWKHINYNNKEAITSLVFYNKKGEEIANYKPSRGKISVTGYFPKGEKYFEGELTGGVKTGKWTYFFKNGAVETEHFYANGKENGVLKDYYSFGQLFMEFPVVDDERHGYYRSWYRNGQLLNEGWFENGERHGLWISYHPNGKLKNETYYIDNRSHGPVRQYTREGQLSNKISSRDNKLIDFTYYDSTGNVLTFSKLENGNGEVNLIYPNGNKRFKVNVLCGEYNDTATWYYSNGQIESEFAMSHGVKEGFYNFFFENGYPKIKGFYKNGNREGDWVYYSEKEKEGISNKGKYVDDNRNGIWYWYWPDNTVRLTINYKDGDRHGIYEISDNKGNLLVEYVFHNNNIISYRYKLKSGEFSEPVEAKHGTVKIEAYYQNQQKSIEENWLNGARHGDQIMYYSNGKLMSKRHYIHGDQHGEEIIYYDNGKPEKLANYYYDNLDGIVKYYRKDGTIEKEENYLIGQLNGWVRYYDNKGNEIKSKLYWDGFHYE